MGADLSDIGRYVYEKYIKRKFVEDPTIKDPLKAFKSGEYKRP